MKVSVVRRYASVCALVVSIGLLPGVVTAAHHEKEEAVTSAEQVNKETKDLLESLKNYSAEQKDEAMKATKEGIDSLDKHIEQLQTQIEDDWDDMDKAAREKSRESLKSMQEQRVKLAEWYGSMKSSSAGAWDHVKEGFSGAYDSLSEAWQKASEEFSKEEKE
ncbi:hypothetical protein L6J37_12435 [Photobacterium sp. WH77]|uniref:hypothetical protein n=1 Tax=unclassified Photobacterium TaxID=2628852 RepID=UPI001EDC67FA|nr:MULTISPECIES: hypothetical protein [unclassified Photobacterium]MCG2837638.1 hypothetical protein [Photobacterium sp. WH77]MCG2845254.1 hypothetical protein [Photobacterium sp. WH80]